MTNSDKREQYRFEHTAPLRYRFAKRAESGAYRVSPPFNGIGAEFSGSGASLRIGKPLPPKTLILLQITFPFQEEPVTLTAEVVHREESEFKGKAVSLVRVKFLVIDPSDQERIVSFVISRGKSASL